MDATDDITQAMRLIRKSSGRMRNAIIGRKMSKKKQDAKERMRNSMPKKMRSSGKRGKGQLTAGGRRHDGKSGI